MIYRREGATTKCQWNRCNERIGGWPHQSIANRTANQKKRLTAHPKDDGRLVPGKLDTGGTTLEGRLADPADLVVASVPDVPGPLGYPVVFQDADPESRLAGSGGRLRGGGKIHGRSRVGCSCRNVGVGGNGRVARSLAGKRGCRARQGEGRHGHAGLVVLGCVALCRVVSRCVARIGEEEDDYLF